MCATPDVRQLNLAQFSMDSLLHGRATAHFAQTGCRRLTRDPSSEHPRNAVLIKTHVRLPR